MRTARGGQPPGLLAGLVLRHVIEVCPQCRQTWELLPVAMQRAIVERLTRHEPPAIDRATPVEHLSLRQTSIEDDEADVARLRRQYNLVRFSLDKLRALEPAGWSGKVQRSKKRFRSRMMVDLMLERVREWDSREPGASPGMLTPLTLEYFETVRNFVLTAKCCTYYALQS